MLSYTIQNHEVERSDERGHETMSQSGDFNIFKETGGLIQ